MTDATATDAEATEAEAAPAPPEERHGVLVTRDAAGTEVLHPPIGEYKRVVKALQDEGYALFIDVTAVDYLAHPRRPLPAGLEPERFEVVAGVLDMENRRRVRVRVQVPEANPVVPTIADLYPGAEAPEREAYDMFGIVFEGHPDLTRILMPEDWEGHPLRKDFSTGRVPVQFKHPGGQR